ncbi:MAG: hypothetical protein U9N34_10525 [Candidatus Cloacimonadota bacterium]|nr:hypothetical protein [Candidatus Cloacimonadota bacterium]
MSEEKKVKKGGILKKVVGIVILGIIPLIIGVFGYLHKLGKKANTEGEEK